MLERAAQRAATTSENADARGAQLGVGGLDDDLLALAAQQRHLGDAGIPTQRRAQHASWNSRSGRSAAPGPRCAASPIGIAGRFSGGTQRVLQHPAGRGRRRADLDRAPPAAAAAAARRPGGRSRRALRPPPRSDANTTST